MKISSAPVLYQPHSTALQTSASAREDRARANPRIDEERRNTSAQERIVEGEVLYGPRASRRTETRNSHFPNTDDFPFVFYRSGSTARTRAAEMDPIATYQVTSRAESYLYPRVGTQVNVFV